jgi:hypothetical protein
MIIFFITFREKVMKLNPAYIYAVWHKYKRETYLFTNRLTQLYLILKYARFE